MGFQSLQHRVQPPLRDKGLSRSPCAGNLGFLAPQNALFSEVSDLGGGTSCPSPPNGNLVDGLPLVAHTGVESTATDPRLYISGCRTRVFLKSSVS